MNPYRTVTSVGLLVLLLGACGGRSLTVRNPQPGNVGLLQGKEISAVAFRPFTQSGVTLEGAHGEGSELEINKSRWFTHVVVGAAKEMGKRLKTAKLIWVGPPSDYAKEMARKHEVEFEFQNAVPASAVLVTGAYVSSREVAGGTRFWLGSMSGKSWTRAKVSMTYGGKAVYGCVVDGKYLGGGFSYGYETLGANEALGKGIVEVIAAVQAGEPVEAAKD